MQAIEEWDPQINADFRTDKYGLTTDKCGFETDLCRSPTD
jgi:hypothetical protein